MGDSIECVGQSSSGFKDPYSDGGKAVLSPRSELIATGVEDSGAMRCFEVVGEYLFVCFASGKMVIYDKSTQAPVRKAIAAHANEIKHIRRGHDGASVITCCLDNQVRTWHSTPERVQSDQPIGPVTTRNDAAKQVNYLITTGSSAANNKKVWAGSMDGKIYVYSETEPGELSDMRVLSHDSMKAGVRCLLDAGPFMFAGMEDGKVAVWDSEAETYKAGGAAHRNIVWSGGHDSKVLALSSRGEVEYHVGTMKDTGEIVQPGGVKAIVQAGLNVWVFHSKGINIYAASSLIEEATEKLGEVMRKAVRMENKWRQSEMRAEQQLVEIDDLKNELRTEQGKWEQLAQEQQEMLARIQADRDAAVQQSRNLQSQVEALQAQSQEQTNEKDAQQKDIETLTQQFEALKSSINTDQSVMQQQLTEKDTELEQLREALASKDTALAESNRHLEAVRSEMGAQQEVHNAEKLAADDSTAALQQQLAAVQQEVKQQAAEAMDRKEQLSAAQSSLAEAEAAVQALRDVKEALQGDLAGAQSARSDLEAAHAASTAELQASRDALAAEHDALEKAHAEQEARLRSIQEQAAGVEAERGRLQALVEELRAGEGESEQRAAELGQQKQVLESQLADSQLQLGEKLSAVQGELADLQQQHSALLEQKEAADLTAGEQVKRIANLREEVARLQSAQETSGNLEAELARLQTEREEAAQQLAAALQDAQAKDSRIDELEAKLEQLQMDLQGTESEKEAAAAKLSAVQEQLASAHAKTAELQEQLQNVGSLSDAAESKASQLESKKRELEEKLQGLVDEVAQLQSRNQQLNASVDQAHEELSAQAKGAAAAEAGSVAAAEEVSRLQASLAEQTRQCAAHEASVAALQRAVERAEQQRDLFQHSAGSETAALQQQCTQLSEELTRSQADCGVARRDADDARRECKDKESKLESYAAANRELNVRLESLRHDLSQLQSAAKTLDEMRRDKRGLEEHVAELQGRVSELRHQVETDRKKAQDVRSRMQDDLARSTAEMNDILEDRYQLQVALKAAQKQLAQAPPPEAVAKMGELEGALRQAMKDYQMLLKEMSSIRSDAKHKQDRIDGLGQQLQASAEELNYYRSEVESMQGLVSELESRIEDLQRALHAKQAELAKSPSFGQARQLEQQQVAPWLPMRTEHPDMHADMYQQPVRTRTPEKVRMIPPTGFV